MSGYEKNAFYIQMKKKNSLKPFFSIIIPVYNVEPYLEMSIKSVLAQDFDSYEIILVDDGSTDSSSEICDKYAAGSAHISVIHKENGGLSDARNQGTKKAGGKYIIYLDADDFFGDRHFLARAFQLIVNARKIPDIVVFGYCKYFSRGKKTVIRMPVKNTYAEGTITDVCKKGCFIISAWGKIINRNLIEEHQIYFRKGLLSEDMEWCAKILTAGSHALVWNAAPYAYRQRKGSISASVTVKHLDDLEYNMEQCIMLGHSCIGERLAAFRTYMAMNVSMYMIILSGMDKNLWKKRIAKIHRWIKFLPYGVRKREQLIKISVSLAGIPGTLHLLRILGKVEHIRRKE